MLWDPFLYCINDSIQGNSETGNKVFVLPSKVAINTAMSKKLIAALFLLDMMSRSGKERYIDGINERY